MRVLLISLLLGSCAAQPVAQVVAAKTGELPAPAAPRVVQVSRPQWLDVDDLQGSGIAVAGNELYVIGDRSSSKQNTIMVFPRAAAGPEALKPLREIPLDVQHDEIRDPSKKRVYAAKICSTTACEPLDIEDLALDGMNAIYVSVEGERDAVIKFDPVSHRAVDLWDHVTGDMGGLGAEGLSVSPDGGLIFVGKQNPPVLSVTNTKTGWVSRGLISVDQINGLAYDARTQQLFVLDSSQNEIVSVQLDGTLRGRYPLGAATDSDPSGRSYQGRKLDAIAIEPGGSVAWVVTDPPHDNPQRPYKPLAGDVLESHYTKIDSMLYRVTFSQ